jgi:hypothetical protein
VAEDERLARLILEVSPAAPMEEIHRAYRVLKRIHGQEAAIFSAPGMDEFSPEARQAILDELEAAYALLCALGPEPEDLPPARPEPEAEDLPAEATALQRARNAAGFSLDQVAAETNVKRDYLSALEEERFEHLRLATVNVRGYLTAYVNAIGLPVEEVVPAYMKKYLDWQALRTS